MYFTYIVECSDGSLYVGKTTDLDRRLKEHNGTTKGGAVYTRSRRPILLRYFEVFPSNSEASKREWALKQLSHLEKKQICISAATDAHPTTNE